MILLLSLFLWYLRFILASSVASIFLALSHLDLGFRSAYLNALLRIFTWASNLYRTQEQEIENEVKEEQTGPESEVSGSEAESWFDVPSEDERAVASPRKVSFVGIPVLARQKSLIEDSIKGIIATITRRKLSLPGNKLLLTEFTGDIARWARGGINSIVADDFTESLKTAEISSWNLMTRTNRGFSYISLPLALVWCFGYIFRYVILFPSRVLIGLFAVCFLLTTTVVGKYLPTKYASRVEEWIHLTFFRILSRMMSLSVTFHNLENRPRSGGICVANHTSPVDVITLSVDNYYALVGQQHGGILGSIQAALGDISDHIWLERGSKSSRDDTKRRLKEHANKNRPPVLLFPEGVCVNNTKALRFRKGSFELGVPIYPVAITYDRRFGDPFWVQATWFQHQLNLMTCWGIRADVYYLPPVRQKEDESAQSFADRVKTSIAQQGGLVQVDFDGFLQYKPQMVQQQAEDVKREYSDRLRKRNISKTEPVVGTEV